MSNASGQGDPASSNATKFVQATCVTVAVAVVTYLLVLSLLAPWAGLMFLPQSNLELVVASALTVAAAAICTYRLARGSTADSEFQRFGDALGDGDDPGGLLASLDDASD